MKRLAPIAAMSLTVLGIAAPLAFRPRPALLWNATASAPVGLYRIRSGAPIRLGDWVAVAAPNPLGQMFAARSYLPLGVPLVKQVAALAPSQVCRSGALVRVDGAPRAIARRTDWFARPLPAWRGCHRLGGDEIFVLNPARDSLDGRYFGPLPRSAVLGRLTPLVIVKGARP